MEKQRKSRKKPKNVQKWYQKFPAGQTDYDSCTYFTFNLVLVKKKKTQKSIKIVKSVSESKMHEEGPVIKVLLPHEWSFLGHFSHCGNTCQDASAIFHFAHFAGRIFSDRFRSSRTPLSLRRVRRSIFEFINDYTRCQLLGWVTRNADSEAVFPPWLCLWVMCHLSFLAHNVTYYVNCQKQGKHLRITRHVCLRLTHVNCISCFPFPAFLFSKYCLL